MADGYLNLPGGAGNYADTPDHADFDVVGDIDIQVEMSMTDWTPATSRAPISKWNATGNQRSWEFFVLATGVLRMRWSPTGSATIVQIDSTAGVGFVDGSRHWVRITVDVDNGASQNVVKFYTSDDGAIWTQLGTTVTTAGASSIFNSTATVRLGSSAASTGLEVVGKIYRARLYDGYDGAGTLKASPDLTANAGGSTYTDPEGHVWTVRGTATLVAASGGPQTVTLGLALEDDSVFTPAVQHLATLGLAQEDDSGFAPAAVHALTLGLAQENDTGNAPSAQHQTTLGLAQETDSVAAVSLARQVALGLAQETESALAVTVALALSLELAQEVNSAAAITLSRLVTLALATETDATQPLTLAHAVALGLAQELDSGHSLSLLRLLALGLAVETDTGFAVTIPGHEPVLVNIRFRLAAKSTQMTLAVKTTSMGLRARTTSMGLRVEGDRVEVTP